MAGPLFHLGMVLATPGVIRLLEEHGPDPGELLARHQSGDWGDLCAEDWKMNECDLWEGGRLFSAYELAGGLGLRVWIFTEADRSTTTILLPDEY